VLAGELSGFGVFGQGLLVHLAQLFWGVLAMEAGGDWADAAAGVQVVWP
jgi:hypothetical protein